MTGLTCWNAASGPTIRHCNRKGVGTPMKYTMSVLVENHPGTLSKVSGLFSRRGFNIDSLAVGITEDPTVSRMTIVVNSFKHISGAFF